MNIFDYLDWRGDLSFTASGLNDVDALIFAWLVYYRFEDLPAEIPENMTLSELAALHEQLHGEFEEVNLSKTFDSAATATWLLACVSRTERFSGVRVGDFAKEQSDAGDEGAETQFAAVSFRFEDGGEPLQVIAYRGTDDSIAGWKEDCYLAISDTVPAQKAALRYFEDTADASPLVLCGHSKGGNLSVFAALFGSEEKVQRIRKIYSFDGPGFSFDMREMPRCALIQDKIVSIVPESSIIGMLLKHGDDYRVVQSKGFGIFQHDAMFWQVVGRNFLYAPKRTDSSVIADKALTDWIDGLSLEERREFLDALFGTLEDTGAVNVSELPEKIAQNGLRSIIRSSMNPQQKKMVKQVLLKLVKAGNAGLYESMVKDRKEPTRLLSETD